MNTLALFGLIVLIIGRLVTLFVALDYWLQQKTRSHELYIIGFGSWILAGLLPILDDAIIDLQVSSMLAALNTGFSSLSIVLIMSGFLCYYDLINFKYLGIYSLFSFFTPILISLLKLDDRLTLILFIVQYMVLILLIVIGLLYRRRIVVQAKSSLKFYYAVIINILVFFAFLVFLVLNGEAYGLYYSTNDTLVLVNYSLGVLLTFFILIFMINLEHDHNHYLMLKFKDNYSHDLGNNLQKIYSSLELIELSKDNEPLESAKRIVVKSAELIEEIRDL